MISIEEVTSKNLKDLEGAIPLLKTQHFYFFDRVDICQLVQKGFLCALLLYKNAELIGYAHLERKANQKDIVTLGIVLIPKERSKGLGCILMKELIKRAREDNIKKINLTVHRNNKPAVRLYEKSGFRVEGLFKEEAGDEDILSMALFLNNGVEAIPWSKPAIGVEEQLEVMETFNSGWFTQGRRTIDFEESVASYVGSKYAVAFNNGTSALLAGYCTLFERGDKVIIPSYTFVSTLNAAAFAGIEPLLVDCDKHTGNISVSHTESLIVKHKPKGIIPVDIAGMPHDAENIQILAEQYGLVVFEDAAEAIGAVHILGEIGSIPDASMISFHAAKLATTVEGGIVTTDDSRLAEKLRRFRNHGEGEQKFIYESIGLNLRFNDVLAAIGIGQIEKLDKFIDTRNLIAALYRDELNGILEFQTVPSYVLRHPYMMFMAMTDERDSLYEFLKSRNIIIRKGWQPIHKQPVWKSLDTSLPNSEELGNKVICLPIYNNMTIEEATKVVEVIEEWNFHGVL